MATTGTNRTCTLLPDSFHKGEVYRAHHRGAVASKSSGALPPRGASLARLLSTGAEFPTNRSRARFGRDNHLSPSSPTVLCINEGQRGNGFVGDRNARQPTKNPQNLQSAWPFSRGQRPRVQGPFARIHPLRRHLQSSTRFSPAAPRCGRARCQREPGRPSGADQEDQAFERLSQAPLILRL